MNSKYIITFVFSIYLVFSERSSGANEFVVYRPLMTRDAKGGVHKSASVMIVENGPQKEGFICILLCSKGPALIGAEVTLMFKGVVVSAFKNEVPVVPANGCLQFSMKAEKRTAENHNDFFGEDIVAVVSSSTK